MENFEKIENSEVLNNVTIEVEEKFDEYEYSVMNANSGAASEFVKRAVETDPMPEIYY